MQASNAREQVALWRQRGFWAANLFLAMWTLVFTGGVCAVACGCASCGAAARLGEEAFSQLTWVPAVTCPLPPAPCPGSLPCPLLLQGIALYLTQPHRDCVAGPSEDCSEAADASIPWRVLFFLACIPGNRMSSSCWSRVGCVGSYVLQHEALSRVDCFAHALFCSSQHPPPLPWRQHDPRFPAPSTPRCLAAAAVWASYIIGWLLVALVAGIEGWADGQEKQAAAVLRMRQELLRQQREEEEQAAALQRQEEAQAAHAIEQQRQQQLQPTMSAGSSKLGGSQVGLDSPLLSSCSQFERNWQQRMLLDLDGPATPLAPPLPSGPADSPTAAAAAEALAAPGGAAAAAPGGTNSAGQQAQSSELPQRVESEALLPPAPDTFGSGIPTCPSKPRSVGPAAGKGHAVGYPEGAAGGADGAGSGGGICRFILSLDASYLAEHVQASKRTACLCLALLLSGTMSM